MLNTIGMFGSFNDFNGPYTFKQPVLYRKNDRLESGACHLYFIDDRVFTLKQMQALYKNKIITLFELVDEVVDPNSQILVVKNTVMENVPDEVCSREKWKQDKTKSVWYRIGDRESNETYLHAIGIFIISRAIDELKRQLELGSFKTPDDLPVKILANFSLGLKFPNTLERLENHYKLFIEEHIPPWTYQMFLDYIQSLTF